jgi:DNA-binding response OmpR family regulator
MPVLIVEDDVAIGDGLLAALAASGLRAVLARDGGAALAAAEAERPALVLLDLGLPDIDGIDLCRQLRLGSPATRIIVVTARDAEMDAVLALDAGADDFVAKPFRLGELLARIRAHLRRVDDGGGVLEQDGLVVDRGGRRVWTDGVELELRAKEFDLLVHLMENQGRVVTRDGLMREVWDEHWHGSTKTLDMTMSTLRRKLGPFGERVSTLRGVGYRFEVG